MANMDGQDDEVAELLADSLQSALQTANEEETRKIQLLKERFTTIPSLSFLDDAFLEEV